MLAGKRNLTELFGYFTILRSLLLILILMLGFLIDV